MKRRAQGDGQIPNETINVGDRVRLKGDIGPNPLWMTVVRIDENPKDANGVVLQGTFMLLAIVTTNQGGGPAIGIQPGIPVNAVTKEQPPANFTH